MKKYITIATLVVASILIGVVVLPGLSADEPIDRSKTQEELKQEMDARMAQHMAMIPATKGQPVERPILYVDDTGSNGVQVTTVLARNGGEYRRSFRPARVMPENAAETVTPSSQKDKRCVVYVVTSTDRTNWYPVSFGQTFPESKTPRYFKMWTEEDKLTNLAALIDKASKEQLDMGEMLRQYVEGSK